MAMLITIGTKMLAMTSASRCTGALLPCASSTSRTMRARVVSLPILVASNRKLPVLLIVAPMTSSPGFLSTGMLSPVIIDSSRLE